jgi:hypothetical protein
VVKSFLIQAAKEGWQAIDQAVLCHLCATMPHRIQAVIKKNIKI